MMVVCLEKNWNETETHRVSLFWFTSVSWNNPACKNWLASVCVWMAVGDEQVIVGGNLLWRAWGIGFVKWMWWVVWTTFFTSLQLWKLFDWLIDHESKEESHHQLHAVLSDCSLKKQVVIQPNCRHTEHPTQNMLMGVLDVKTHQTKPQNTWEKANFVPSCHGAFVAKMLDKDCTLTLKQLVDLCKWKFRKTFSRLTISRSIKAFHYSHKRTDLRTERSENPQAIHEREVYAANFHKKFSDDPASFFFMDEVGFSVSMWHAYGYSPWNKPATVTAPTIRSQNISTIALIGMPKGEPLEKTMVIKVLPCPGNTEQCRLFMVEALDKLQKKGD